MYLYLYYKCVFINNIEIDTYVSLVLNYKSKYLKDQIHAVSRTQQGRQREPSVKKLHSPLSAEF